MLTITIPETELYDEIKEEFITSKACTLVLEHSLVSLSKWESFWKKPFLSREPKTFEESISYIRCMTITQNVDESIFTFIDPEMVKVIGNYIEDSMTATTFSKGDQRINRETITAEIIYYWMVALNIPFECQKWHLNRLLTLINVCNIKNQPPKKANKQAILSKNAALNAARRQALNTKG